MDPWHGPGHINRSFWKWHGLLKWWFPSSLFFWGKNGGSTSIFKTTQTFGMGAFCVLSRLKCPQWILLAGTLRRHTDRRILELNTYQWPVIVDKKVFTMIPPPKESARMVFEQEMIWAVVIVCDMFEQIEMWSCFFLWKTRVEWGSETIGITYYHILSICIHIYHIYIYMSIHDLLDNEDVGFHHPRLGYGLTSGKPVFSWPGWKVGSRIAVGPSA